MYAIESPSPSTGTNKEDSWNLELSGNPFVSYMFLYVFKSIFLFQEAAVSIGPIQCHKENDVRLFLTINNVFTVVAQDLLLLWIHKTAGLRGISWRMGF